METKVRNTPDYIVYNVRDDGKDDSFWDRIGAAWEHKDGEGLNVTLDAIPLDGRITLRKKAA